MNLESFKKVTVAVGLSVILFAQLAGAQQRSDEGTNSGGGGDPSHIEAQIRRQRSAMGSAIDGVANAQRLAQEAEARRIEREARQAAVRQSLISAMAQVIGLFNVLKFLDFPLNIDTRITSELLINTVLRIKSNPNSIRITDSLTLPNSRGAMTPVAFVSDPVAFTIQVDYDRMHGPPYEDNYVWSVPVLATVFHELLVLNNIEPSMTYTHSNQFALALREIRNPNFLTWAVSQPAVRACAKSQFEAVAFHRDVMVYVSRVNPGGYDTSQLLATIDRCLVGMPQAVYYQLQEYRNLGFE